MNSDTARKLAHTLIQQTQSNRIKWRPNATLDGYLSDIDGTTIEITRARGNPILQNEGTYTLQVRDASGDLIDGDSEKIGPFASISGIPGLGFQALFNAIASAKSRSINNLIEKINSK